MTITAAEVPTLFTTKLYVPHPRVGQVVRTGLLERLHAGLDGCSALTLISAPAGFGKTTLMSAWVDGLPSGRRVAWLSLGEEDNDPAGFWTYVIAALQTALPGIAADLMARLHSPEVPEAEELVVALVNALAAAEPVLLILDDYHEIVAQSIHDGVARLLEHLPPSCHLVIAGRTDPPLPVAALRAGGRLSELRARDLRFTRGEAVAFCNATMQLGLTQAEVETLARRTEGWVAGLQLAALSLQGRADAGAFVRAFAGSHRYVIDYLVEEVLERQPLERQAFLLRTSVLRTLSGPLCDALTGRDDGQATLEQLEVAQLFVVPLDDERHWYRYHHLFAEFLRSRLNQRWPGEATRLHSRAAAWFESEGRLREAVYHALAAEAYEDAVALVQREAHTLLSHGDSGTLLGWLSSLPEALLRRHPELGVIFALVNVYSLRLDAMGRRLESVAAALPECPPSKDADAAEVRSLWGRWHAVRAYWIRLTAQDYEASLVDTARALELLPEAPASQATCFWRNLAQLNRGFTMVVGYNQLVAAADAFAEVVNGACAALNPYGALTGLSFLGRMQAGQGRLYAADATYQRALALIDTLGARDWQLSGYVAYGLGELAWLWNRLDDAQSWLDQAHESGVRNGNVETIVNCLVLKARLACARGEDAAMRALCAELADAGRRFPYPRLAETIDGVEVDLLLTRRALAGPSFSGTCEAYEDLATVRRWVAAQDWAAIEAGQLGRVINFGDAPMTYAILARALIALARSDEALDLVLRTLAALEGRGAMHVEMRLKMLHALALDAQGQRSAALAVLAGNLTAVELDDLVRPLVEEGAAMAQLLVALLDGSGGAPTLSGVTRTFAARVLAAFPPGLVEAPPGAVGEVPVVAAAPEAPKGTVALVDPLTEREMEILRYLRSELSTPEIADTLYVAPSTVRTHVKNIYSKLDTHNRGEAVARATELGLL